MHPHRSRAYGMVLVAIAAVLWSTAGLFVRALHLDVWTMLGWRAVFAALSLTAIAVWQNGRGTLGALRTMGRPGLAAIPIAAISMGSYRCVST